MTNDTLPGKPLTDNTYTYAQVLAVKARTISELYAKGQLTEHSTGVTYIIKLPNGLVKIGFTTALFNRLTRLSTIHGAKVVPLAVLTGGFTQEQCLHHRFKDYRQWVTGEMFNPADELMSFVAEAGFCPESLEELREFATWQLGQSRNRKPVGPHRVSTFNGVTWNREHAKWRVRIKVNGQDHYLGYFVNDTDAAKCYDSFIVEHNLYRPTNASLGLL